MVLFDFIGICNTIGDDLCSVCIQLMKFATALYGISYGLINVLLFVVLGPTSTIAFMIAWIMEKLKKKKTSKVLFIIGLVETLIVVGAIAITMMYRVLYVIDQATCTREWEDVDSIEQYYDNLSKSEHEYLKQYNIENIEQN